MESMTQVTQSAPPHPPLPYVEVIDEAGRIHHVLVAHHDTQRSRGCRVMRGRCGKWVTLAADPQEDVWLCGPCGERAEDDSWPSGVGRHHRTASGQWPR